MIKLLSAYIFLLYFPNFTNNLFYLRVNDKKGTCVQVHSKRCGTVNHSCRLTGSWRFLNFFYLSRLSNCLGFCYPMIKCRVYLCIPCLNKKECLKTRSSMRHVFGLEQGV
uniref:Putative secreted protein n=1 Tax=Ixodes ricinus TaxID=34613 RepID=A0A6B0UJ31_IXORI